MKNNFQFFILTRHCYLKMVVSSTEAFHPHSILFYCEYTILVFGAAAQGGGRRNELHTTTLHQLIALDIVGSLPMLFNLLSMLLISSNQSLFNLLFSLFEAYTCLPKTFTHVMKNLCMRHSRAVFHKLLQGSTICVSEAQ